MPDTPAAAPKFIYKIVPASLWREAERIGRLDGAPVDLADGCIHFSTAEQVRESGGKQFSGQDDLLLVTVDTNLLHDALVYEPSRGGALFPHLYAPLPLEAVSSVEPLPMNPDGSHVYPKSIA
ncbi:MAG TPA: DUF952 domain-containing protein [Saliniramus sp.]|nr:DUF952 domain-containing protein [Saliniramus sp.]